MAKTTKSTKTTKPEIKVETKKVTKTTEGIITPEKRAELFLALTKKYKFHTFVPDSLKLPGENKDYPTKRSVTIVCPDCKGTRNLATSDIFQVHRCVKCTKVHKKGEVANETKVAKPKAEKKI